MSLPVEQLETEALELPRRERARLAHRLTISLDEAVDEDPAEVERAWEAQIRRRVAELEAGTAELVPAEQVFAELRARPRGRARERRVRFLGAARAHQRRPGYRLRRL